MAEAEGRESTGLLGLLLAGVEAGAIPASRARAILEKLARSSYRMSADLYGEVLRRLGDRPGPRRRCGSESRGVRKREERTVEEIV